MLKIFRMLKSWQVQAGLLVINLVLSFIGLYAFFLSYNFAKNLLTQQISRRELVLARSSSASIQAFFTNIEQQMINLSSTGIISLPDYNVRRGSLQGIINNNKGLIGNIFVFNKDGILIAEINRQNIRDVENKSFSTFDFIKWSKSGNNSEKIYISTSYIASYGTIKGKNVIALATPLYNKSQFLGTLAIELVTEEFTKTFILPLGYFRGDDAFITDIEGILIAGNKKLLNTNLADYALKNKWKGSKQFAELFKKMLNNPQNEITWNFKYPGEHTRSLIVASSKIDIPATDRDLILVVSHPKDSVESSLYPLYKYEMGWLIFGLINTVFSGILLIFFTNPRLITRLKNKLFK